METSGVFTVAAQSERDPNSQFQVGDKVLYLPEGVFAVVVGYVWIEAIGELPRIGAYRLSVGIEVPERSLRLRWSKSGPA